MLHDEHILGMIDDVPAANNGKRGQESKEPLCKSSIPKHLHDRFQDEMQTQIDDEVPIPTIQ